MKKICIVTKNMMSGGTERVVAQLIEYFVNQEIQVSVILVDKRPIHYELPEECKVTVIGPQKESPIADKLVRYRKVRSLVMERRPDVVLSMPEEIGIYVIGAMLGTGIPVVVSERNNPWVMPYKKETRLLRRLMYPLAKGLIFQTEQAAAFFPKGQQKKGIVLPNPLDLSRLPAPFFGEREKTVISAGRLDKQKNFPLLIEAFGIFHKKHPDYTLTIYGEGNQREPLEALAARTLPEGSWQLPGRVADLPQRLGKSGIFALSSDYEGVPNVLIEAMAMGTPSVSTDCAPGGAASLIENGKNGLLVSVGDAQALADGMCALAGNSAAAKEMGKNAVRIRDRLDADVVAADWLEYLKGCTIRK